MRVCNCELAGYHARSQIQDSSKVTVEMNMNLYEIYLMVTFVIVNVHVIVLDLINGIK